MLATDVEMVVLTEPVVDLSCSAPLSAVRPAPIQLPQEFSIVFSIPVVSDDPADIHAAVDDHVRSQSSLTLARVAELHPRTTRSVSVLKSGNRDGR